jgi:hypothetical protein
MADDFILRVPPHSLRWFPEGERCEVAQPGDEFLIRHGTVFADAIAAGQKVMSITETELRGFTWLNHTAFAKDAITLSQMGPRGYEEAAIADYDKRLYCVAHYDVTPEQRQAAVLFDQSCANVDYGWSEYVDDILDGLTHLKFVGSWGDNIICSTHLTMVTMAMGFMPALMPNAVIPAHRAMWLGAKH